MAESAIRAIVFDFGGVFTHSAVAQARLRGYEQMLGLPPDTLQSALFAGETWELRSTGQITAEAYWERAGRPYEADLPVEFRKFRTGMFWAEPINEEMVVFAQALHRHYCLALCSNALPELSEILDTRPDLAQLFDVRVISVVDGLRKPDPAMFRLTAERLQLPLETCLLIDDKARNTEAAEAIGMPAIVFQSKEQLVVDLAARGVLVPDA